MEVKPGYKHTEVGIIPEDWEMSKLGAVGEVIRGASPRPKGDKRFYGGSIPRLMVEDVTRDGKIVFPQVDFLTQEGAKRSRPCKKGTLTIVCSGNVGIPSFLGEDACIHDGFLAIVSIRDRISKDYLYHQLCRLRQSFDSSATHGGVFTNLTTTGVKEFLVPLPSAKAEQEAIAEALSDADILIESLEQLIVKKRQIKQGVMQELLTGKKRLPGFELKKGYKQTEVGVIPEDWIEAKIKSITIKIGSGITPTGGSKRYGEYGRPFVRSQNVGWGRLMLDDLAFIDEETHRGFAGTELLRDDVLLNITGASIGRTALAENSVIGGNVNQHVCIIRADSKIAFPRLINLLLLSAIGQGQIESFQAGGNRQGLNFAQIGSIKLPLPSNRAEQEAIATVLVDMGSEIAALDTKLAKARQIKQGMMQELLTGRIRLI